MKIGNAFRWPLATAIIVGKKYNTKLTINIHIASPAIHSTSFSNIYCVIFIDYLVRKQAKTYTTFFTNLIIFSAENSCFFPSVKK